MQIKVKDRPKKGQILIKVRYEGKTIVQHWLSYDDANTLADEIKEIIGEEAELTYEQAIMRDAR